MIYNFFAKNTSTKSRLGQYTKFRSGIHIRARLLKQVILSVFKIHAHLFNLQNISNTNNKTAEES